MIDLMQKNWEWGEFQPGGQFGEQCLKVFEFERSNFKPKFQRSGSSFFLLKVRTFRKNAFTVISINTAEI